MQYNMYRNGKKKKQIRLPISSFIGPKLLFPQIRNLLVLAKKKHNNKKTNILYRVTKWLFSAYIFRHTLLCGLSLNSLTVSMNQYVHVRYTGFLSSIKKIRPKRHQIASLTLSSLQNYQIYVAFETIGQKRQVD